MHVAIAIFEKKVKKLNLEENVLFCCAQNDIYRYYNAFDVFVLPSRYEGLPVVGIEAQINGLPCFFSDKMTYETLFSSSSKFLKSNNNAGEWANEIINVCDNNNRIFKGNNNFDIEVQAKKLEKFYEKF